MIYNIIIFFIKLLSTVSSAVSLGGLTLLFDFYSVYFSMEEYRKQYIIILNRFKAGKILLSRDRVLQYLAAIKYNMKICEENMHNCIDLVIDDIKAAKVVSGDYADFVVLSPFIFWCSHQKFARLLLICETHTQVDKKITMCKIIRMNYDEELENVSLVDLPIDKDMKQRLKFATFDELEYMKDSVITYYPDTNTFLESHDCCKEDAKPDKNGSIKILKNHNSTIIVAPKEYYNYFITILPDIFIEIKIKFWHHHVRFTLAESIGVQRKYIIGKLLAMLNADRR